MGKFKIFEFEELKNFIESQNISRAITQIHYHHTWKPSHKDYTGSNGIKLQENMENYHVNVNKWSEIGQHFTLLPDGKFVTGRDLNKNPASIKGWNNGAVALEMLGNFDKGNDILKGKQLENAVRFGAFFIAKFNLTIDSIKFHRDHPAAGKTCPGTGVDKNYLLNLINQKLDYSTLINYYKDADKISPWAVTYVKKLYNLNIMVGDENGYFKPQSILTREQAATLIGKLLNYLGK